MELKKATSSNSFFVLFNNFIKRPSTGTILLLLCTFVALLWANSPWGSVYERFFSTIIGINIGNISFEHDLLHWINDGLMAVFFLMIGLDIKQEMVAGDLTDLRQASLPLVAAVGGVIAPAGIFILFNHQPPEIAGWGIPIATDIAFSLAILHALGRRIPVGILIFLATLAIADDLYAIIVIALFYGTAISWFYLLAAAFIFALLLLFNRLGNNNMLLYIILGLVLWATLINSGVHATIAGVLLAITIPAKSKINSQDFLAQTTKELNKLQDSNLSGYDILVSKPTRKTLEQINYFSCSFQPPLQRLKTTIKPFVYLFIVPVFALANAGVIIDTSSIATLKEPLALGIMLGLVIGKPLGITLTTWLLVHFKVTTLPKNVTWHHMIGAGSLAGIGFTMCIFIASLSFTSNDLLNTAKISILLASAISVIVGTLILLATQKKCEPERNSVPQKGHANNSNRVANVEATSQC
ncbi:MAG: Na+/H+ antiporter NhaA [Syntrophomonadaceae bacterium]|jgi:NhaA family Na+:H+ antiporter